MVRNHPDFPPPPMPHWKYETKGDVMNKPYKTVEIFGNMVDVCQYLNTPEIDSKYQLVAIDCDHSNSSMMILLREKGFKKQEVSANKHKKGCRACHGSGGKKTNPCKICNGTGFVEVSSD